MHEVRKLIKREVPLTRKDVSCYGQVRPSSRSTFRCSVTRDRWRARAAGVYAPQACTRRWRGRRAGVGRVAALWLLNDEVGLASGLSAGLARHSLSPFMTATRSWSMSPQSWPAPVRWSASSTPCATSRCQAGWRPGPRCGGPWTRAPGRTGPDR